MLKRKCTVCGKTFHTYPSHNYRRCSLECRKKHRKQQSLVEKECICCGKQFKLNKCFSNIQCYRYKTCSDGCYKEYKDKIKRLRQQKLQHVCTNCGKKFKAKRSNKTDMVFCSQDCSRKYMKGKNSPFFVKGKTRHAGGYVSVYVSPQKYMLEHRLVVEKYLGRKLKDDEQIHHIDGDKTNNSIDNLAIMSCAEHSRLHTKRRYHADYGEQNFRPVQTYNSGKQEEYHERKTFNTDKALN